jgi:HEAT repeat protein
LLQLFGDDQVERFAERYFQEAGRVEEFRSALEDAGALREMAEVPLLLSLICRAYEKEGYPSFLNRKSVYKKVVREMLLAGWRRSRRSGISGDDLDDRLNELSAMASALKVSGNSELHSEDLRGAIKFGYRRVYSEEPKKEQVDDRRREYTRELGIISVNDKEYRSREYRFIHPTIQKYLFTRWVGKKIDNEGINTEIKGVNGDRRDVILAITKHFKSSRGSGKESVLNREYLPLLAEILEDPDPLLELLIAHSKSDDEHAREAAAVVLGKTAVALGEANAYDSKVVKALCDRLSDCEWSVREAAAEALGKIKTIGSEVISSLTEMFFSEEEKESVREAAFRSLEMVREVDPETVEEVVEKATCRLGELKEFADRLGDERKEVRRTEARKLQWIMCLAPKAVEESIVKSLTDKSAKVHKNPGRALRAFGKVVASSSDVVENLAVRLADKKPDVVADIARKLGDTSSLTTTAMGLLTKLLKNGVWRVRKAAVLEIGKTGTSKPEVLTAIARRLEDGDSYVVEAAKQALERIVDSNPRAAWILTGRLMAEDPAVRESAVEVLEGFFSESRDSTSEISGAFVTPEVVELVKQLEHKSESQRQAAAERLGKSSTSPEVVKVLAGRLGDEDWHVRKAVVRALGRITGDSRFAYRIPVEEVPFIRKIALLALERAEELVLPEIEAGEVEPLIDWLEEESAPLRKTAARMLGRAEASDPRVVKALTGRFTDSDFCVRRTAARALGRIASSDSRVIRFLIKHLEDEGTVVREAAARSLGELEGAGSEATEALRSRLEDESVDVQKTAAEALEKIDRSGLRSSG